MKLKFIATVLTASLLTITTSYAMPQEPEKCPDASAMQNIGFDAVEQDKDGTWIAGVMSNQFDTSDDWTFVIGKIKAKNQAEATSKARDSLKTLRFRQGPMPIEQIQVWGCLYSTAAGYPAITVTPALGLSSTSQLLK